MAGEIAPKPISNNFQAVEWGGYSDVILTSGSDLNKTSLDSWPGIIDAGYKIHNAWRYNALHQVQTVKTAANFGLSGALTNWGFRAREFAGVGSMPGPVPYAGRPTYNNLTPIAYNLRVNDPLSQAQNTELMNQTVIQNGPTDFTPAGSASLAEVVR